MKDRKSIQGHKWLQKIEIDGELVTFYRVCRGEDGRIHRRARLAVLTPAQLEKLAARLGTPRKATWFYPTYVDET